MFKVERDLIMYNPFSLSDKRILVTGASSGIGRAIAIECSKIGATVILSARNKERLEETLSLMHNSSSHEIIEADLSNTGDVYSLAKSITIELDGIVHSAGYTISKPFNFISEKDIDNLMQVNFKSPVLLTQQLLKNKRLKKKASVVFISSISGVCISAVAGSLYSASKAAVNGIIKGMAIEFATKQIRVNSVNPGMIDTNIFAEGIITAEQLNEDIKNYPLKRYGKPEEVAYAVIYLLADASLWVTGTSLIIDGGYTLL